MSWWSQLIAQFIMGPSSCYKGTWKAIYDLFDIDFIHNDILINLQLCKNIESW